MQKNKWINLGVIIFIGNLFSACGSNLVIIPDNLKTTVVYTNSEEPIESLGIGKYNTNIREIRESVNKKFKKWSLFASPSEIRLQEKLIQKRKRKIPIMDFEIVTKFTFWDTVLGLIPFTSRRTIELSGNYVDETEVNRITKGILHGTLQGTREGILRKVTKDGPVDSLDSYSEISP